MVDGFPFEDTAPVTAGSGTAITVPADSDGSDAFINGFVGDIIVLNGSATNVCKSMKFSVASDAATHAKQRLRG